MLLPRAATIAVCAFLLGAAPASADPLLDAAESGDAGQVRQLIKGGADLNRQGRLGAPLHRALVKKHADVAILLVAGGADVNLANPVLGTPLHVTAATGDADMVLLLLDHGADPNVARRSDGFTPLHVAADGGRVAVVRLLLDRGADVNRLSHDQTGAPALHLAQLHDRQDVAAILLAAGATPPPVTPILPLMATADAERGRAVALNCSGCHAVDPQDRRRTTGPLLWGVVGRTPASVPGYAYSPALQRLGGTWTEETLSAFIAHPMATAPGTKMGYDGLASAGKRADLVAYLRTLGEPPSPAP